MEEQPDSSSPPRDPPEQNSVPELTGESERVRGSRRVAIDRELAERVISHIHQKSSSMLEVCRLWEEFEKEIDLKQLALSKKILEFEKKEERLKFVEERESKIDLLEVSINERLKLVEERENKIEESDLKLVLERNVMKLLLVMENEKLKKQEKSLGLCHVSLVKKREKMVKELDAKKEEIRLLSKSNSERMKKEAEMMEIARKELEAREKELKKKEDEFEMKREGEAREIEEKSKFLQEWEKELEMKQREFGARLVQAETGIRRRKKHKHNHIAEITSSCVDEDDEPLFDCVEPDFNEFNNTMESFKVGQVWALYDPIDDMPRYYARIKGVLKKDKSLRVTWLEPRENEKLIPISCGRFKYGESETKSLAMFSHEMLHIGRSRNVVIYPREGETWALFRDREQHKAPYRYDFVEVISEFDDEQGIGVAYLGRMEGLTSVYVLANQNGVIKMMISPDEMLRFSHRVPSFKLLGDEKEGIPDGSFELDTAAIPQACLNEYSLVLV